jgi:AcrR family transcriptional regulator
MSINAVKDLRVRRTQKWLQDALIQLMREKPYRDIQVTEVTDRAQVSRPTFYLHYRSKDELLLSLIDQAFMEFYSDLVAATLVGEYTRLKLCTQLFAYWERHPDLLKLIAGADVQREIIERLQNYLRQILLHLKAQTGKPAADGHALDLMVSFMASGTYALLSRWGLEGLPYSAEQMGRFLHELTATHDDVTLTA